MKERKKDWDENKRGERRKEKRAGMEREDGGYRGKDGVERDCERDILIWS